MWEVSPLLCLLGDARLLSSTVGRSWILDIENCVGGRKGDGVSLGLQLCTSVVSFTRVSQEDAFQGDFFGFSQSKPRHFLVLHSALSWCFDLCVQNHLSIQEPLLFAV